MNRNDGAVGDARKRAAEFDQALDQTRTEYREALDRLGDTHAQTDVAQIAHALTCIRCRMDWYCGGLCEDDYENAGRIADLLARVVADAKAEALREAADDIAGRLRRGENPDLGHVAVDWLRNRAEATR